MKLIKKKILPKYFKDVVENKKHFELRKDEDDAQVGDFLRLREYTEEQGYTGDYVEREILYVLRDVPEYGLQPGYCIIGW